VGLIELKSRCNRDSGRGTAQHSGRQVYDLAARGALRMKVTRPESHRRGTVVSTEAPVEVDMRENAGFGQRFEGPVDGGLVHIGVVGGHLFEQLLCRQMLIAGGDYLR
jgi:hypothetical protein